MEASLKQLKEKDIRVTPQRIAVYRTLVQHKHLTAEEIYEKIKTSIPAVSLATVYTVLDLFREKGLISEVYIQADRACFEIRLDAHHHLLCKQCHTIYDINIPLCPTLAKREVEGHAIEELHGYFYGICSRCRGKKNGERP